MIGIHSLRDLVRPVYDLIALILQTVIEDQDGCQGHVIGLEELALDYLVINCEEILEVIFGRFCQSHLAQDHEFHDVPEVRQEACILVKEFSAVLHLVDIRFLAFGREDESCCHAHQFILKEKLVVYRSAVLYE